MRKKIKILMIKIKLKKSQGLNQYKTRQEIMNKILKLKMNKVPQLKKNLIKLEQPKIVFKERI
jgi:hypothetical protein